MPSIGSVVLNFRDFDQILSKVKFFYEKFSMKSNNALNVYFSMEVYPGLPTLHFISSFFCTWEALFS